MSSKVDLEENKVGKSCYHFLYSSCRLFPKELGLKRVKGCHVATDASTDLVSERVSEREQPRVQFLGIVVVAAALLLIVFFARYPP